MTCTDNKPAGRQAKLLQQVADTCAASRSHLDRKALSYPNGSAHVQDIIDPLADLVEQLRQARQAIEGSATLDELQALLAQAFDGFDENGKATKHYSPSTREQEGTVE